MKLGVVWLVGLACVTAAAATASPAVSDTPRCSPVVALRDSATGVPHKGVAYVVVYRFLPADSNTVETVTSVEVTGGVAEFSSLLPGRYLACTFGEFDRRLLPGWQPPARRRTMANTGVGTDPWQQPTQIRKFSGYHEWSVSRGDCSDSLLVQVAPREWETVGEMIVLGCGLPPRYRVRPALPVDLRP